MQIPFPCHQDSTWHIVHVFNNEFRNSQSQTACLSKYVSGRCFLAHGAQNPSLYAKCWWPTRVVHDPVLASRIIYSVHACLSMCVWEKREGGKGRREERGWDWQRKALWASMKKKWELREHEQKWKEKWQHVWGEGCMWKLFFLSTAYAI
jgi:hypothetical protein